ncbi:hypothetical protein [Rhodoflexus caldus]|uniref:hypothetical protein n=1 Tax=Rhodoflexus caldus TaxID=2891236 RepID=UPI00202A6C9B|nr:hypothetical protein [Rhodoflexus caldus]
MEQLQNILGVIDKNGIKTNVTVQLTPETYRNLAGAIVFAFLLCVMIWFAFKKLAK